MLLSQPLWLCSATFGKPLYQEEECSALLGFKSSFFSESHCDFGYGISTPRKMMWWKAAKEGMAGDCCNWGGVTCDEGDGHVIGLDLSGSCLMGIINSEASIFDLVYLQDLSRTIGLIPLSLAKLSRREALDLSRNKLPGEIPAKLMQVTFHEIFNVSYNNLSGPIPEGNQFSTFENNSYIGSLELCGSPLTKKCGKLLQPSSSLACSQEQKLRLSFGMAWITAAIGLAGGLIVGVALERAFGNDVLDWLARKWHKYRRSTA